MTAGGIATQGMAMLDDGVWKPIPGGGPAMPCYSLASYKSNLLAAGSGSVKLYDGSNWTTLVTTTIYATAMYHAPE